mmetsp:Transcript_21288/g.73460  ORF Transcript_21288/g.73460 Transcript_21288/m.73460 type:complete len:495 (-) Transcript_21288:54-1538(-)
MAHCGRVLAACAALCCSVDGRVYAGAGRGLSLYGGPHGLGAALAQRRRARHPLFALRGGGGADDDDDDDDVPASTLAHDDEVNNDVPVSALAQDDDDDVPVSALATRDEDDDDPAVTAAKAWRARVLESWPSNRAVVPPAMPAGAQPPAEPRRVRQKVRPSLACAAVPDLGARKAHGGPGAPPSSRRKAPSLACPADDDDVPLSALLPRWEDDDADDMDLECVAVVRPLLAKAPQGPKLPRGPRRPPSKVSAPYSRVGRGPNVVSTVPKKLGRPLKYLDGLGKKAHDKRNKVIKVMKYVGVTEVDGRFKAEFLRSVGLFDTAALAAAAVDGFAREKGLVGVLNFLEDGTLNLKRFKNMRLTSKHKFVSWHIKLQRWIGRANVGGVLQFLGHFDDEDEAARVAADIEAGRLNYDDFVKQSRPAGHYVATVPQTLAVARGGYDVSTQTDFPDDDVAPMATTDAGKHAELFARSAGRKRPKTAPKTAPKPNKSFRTL